MKPKRFDDTCSRCKQRRSVRIGADGKVSAFVNFKRCADKDACGAELFEAAKPEFERQNAAIAAAQEKRERRAAKRAGSL